jgi:hypothetical protein
MRGAEAGRGDLRVAESSLEDGWPREDGGAVARLLPEEKLRRGHVRGERETQNPSQFSRSGVGLIDPRRS